MQSMILVANPASSGFSRPLHRRVVAALGATFDIRPVWPSSADHARELTGKAVADGVDLVAAMGGDGIIHHVAQAMIGSDTPLVVIPCGTANVVARQFDIPTRATAAAKMFAHGYDLVNAPTVEVSGTATDGPLLRHVVFSLGVGADADIVKAAESNPLRKRDFGPLHYFTTALSQVRRDIGHRVAELRIDAGERSTLAIGAMAQFRPSYTYFGRAAMRLSPSEPDPITLVIVEQLRVRRAPSMMRATIGKSGLESVKGFDAWTGVEEFTVKAGHPTTLQADGEVIGGIWEITARHRPDALVFAVPPADRHRRSHD
jgi:diacylglycerol kinase family enzyme